MRNWMKKNGLILALILAPFVILALVWNQIPAEVPIHWNIKGEADNFASKEFGMLLMPLSALFAQALIWVIPALDPKKRTEEFSKTLQVLQIVLGFFFLGIFILILMATLGMVKDIGSFVLPAVIILLGILGNYFTRLRPNYFVGIRTPWTLENENNWRKTHRFGGRLWVIGSLMMLCIFPFLKAEIFYWFFMIGVMVLSLGPILYSFMLFQRGNQ
ncbi:MAG: SdpI family protein [Bacteroidota bacterium]